MNPKLKRNAVLVCLSVAALANFIHTALKAPSVQKFYRYDTPAFYNEAFFDEGRYPDLFLRLAIREKEVMLPRESRTYASYPSFGRDEEDGNPFDARYFKENNYVRYFEEYASSVTVDKNLPFGEEVEAALKPALGRFSDFGIANDMLRYSFPLNQEKIQQATAFWYYWYYHSFAEENPGEPGSFPKIRIALEGLTEAERLVALWDENENLYLMAEPVAEELGLLSPGGDS
ncbi:MAG: hypothetical protein K5985_06990 [Lachnospiraceae bacterium]|nr:hypothetical protein [Lachnospiraceae bacterium]